MQKRVVRDRPIPWAALGSEFTASFWSRVDHNEFDLNPDRCWLWLGLTYAEHGFNGYASQYGACEYGPAHRVAYFLVHEEQPGRLYVCHKCDVPRCVNPAHLFLGTAKDNTQDMLAKGRHR